MRWFSRGGVLGALAGALTAQAAPAELIQQNLQRCANDAACLAAAEVLALRDAAGMVRRDGAVLTLHFGLQAPARFDDQPGLGHTYLGRLDGVLLHVVRAGASHALWLVGESGQPPLKVAAVPVPAPGGRHFVVVAANTLALYQRSGPRWSLQFRYDAPAGLAWQLKSWRPDAAAVRLDWHCAGQATGGSLQLRDGPYGWDLVPEPPARCTPLRG
jgi:hypothetical protein